MNMFIGNTPRRIVDQVRSQREASLAGQALLRSLRGIHPLDVEDTLSSAYESDLLHVAMTGVKTSLPVLHEIVRDDNPVLSFWPFTRKTVQTIANMCRDHPRVALFGVPTVFSILKNLSTSKVTLFESDDYHFARNTTPGFFRCDLVSEIPNTFDKKFDLIVGDPPWYGEEYLAWLNVAMRLLRRGGKLVFVLFPEGIRDSARAERDSILSVARESFPDLSLDFNAAEYETPSFEQVEMLHKGLLPINWRSADLISGHLLEDKRSISTGRSRLRSDDWEERRIGCGRLFIRETSRDQSSQFLSYADSYGPILSSPSRRALGRDRANVLSSRGHGLSCNDPARLVEIVEAIKEAKDIDIVSETLSDPSKEIFRSIANDLWGRFISVKRA